MPDSNSPDSGSSDSDSSGIVNPPTLRLSNKRDRAMAEQDYTPIKGFRTELPETHVQKRTKQSGKRYVFKEKYLMKWKWLVYDTENKVAYCSFAGCSMYNPLGGFVNQ